MSLTISVDAQFGTGKPNLTGVTFQLLDSDGVTPVGGLISGAAVKNLGEGGYGCDLTLPDSFTHGYVLAAANDGSGDIVTFSVNLADLGNAAAQATQHLARITVQTAGNAPVANAVVVVRSGTTTVQYGVTNGSGQVALVLPAGTYTILVDAGPTYSQVTNGSLTMPGNADVTGTFTLTPQTASAPSTGGFCVVSVGYQVNDTPVTGAAVLARLLTQNGLSGSNFLSTQYVRVTTGDSAHGWPAGYAELTLAQGEQYEVRIVDGAGPGESPDPLRRVPSVVGRITVPPAGTAALEGLLT